MKKKDQTQRSKPEYLTDRRTLDTMYMYTCTHISQLFVNCFLLFEALMEEWRAVKWVASWNKVFIISVIITIIIIIINDSLH